MEYCDEKNIQHFKPTEPFVVALSKRKRHVKVKEVSKEVNPIKRKKKPKKIVVARGKPKNVDATLNNPAPDIFVSNLEQGVPSMTALGDSAKYFQQMIGMFSLQNDLQNLYFESLQKSIHSSLSQSYSLGNIHSVKKKNATTISENSFFFLFGDSVKIGEKEVINGLRKISFLSIDRVLATLQTIKREYSLMDKERKMTSFIAVWGMKNGKRGLILSVDLQFLKCLMFFPVMSCDRSHDDPPPVMCPMYNMIMVGLLKQCDWNDISGCTPFVLTHDHKGLTTMMFEFSVADSTGYISSGITV